MISVSKLVSNIKRFLYILNIFESPGVVENVILSHPTKKLPFWKERSMQYFYKSVIHMSHFISFTLVQNIPLNIE